MTVTHWWCLRTQSEITCSYNHWWRFLRLQCYFKFLLLILFLISSPPPSATTFSVPDNAITRISNCKMGLICKSLFLFTIIIIIIGAWESNPAPCESSGSSLALSYAPVPSILTKLWWLNRPHLYGYATDINILLLWLQSCGKYFYLNLCTLLPSFPQTRRRV